MWSGESHHILTVGTLCAVKPALPCVSFWLYPYKDHFNTRWRKTIFITIAILTLYDSESIHKLLLTRLLNVDGTKETQLNHRAMCSTWLAYNTHMLEYSCSSFSKMTSVWRHFGFNNVIISFRIESICEVFHTYFIHRHLQTNVSGALNSSANKHDRLTSVHCSTSTNSGGVKNITSSTVYFIWKALHPYNFCFNKKPFTNVRL